MRLTLCFAILALLTNCSPDSLVDYRSEEEARCHALCKTLKEIQYPQDLALKAPSVKSHFEKIVDVILLARAYQINHPDEVVEPIDPIFQQALKDELMRVYQLEGGREMVEKAAHEALIRLDAREKALFKK